MKGIKYYKWWRSLPKKRRKELRYDRKNQIKFDPPWVREAFRY